MSLSSEIWNYFLPHESYIAYLYGLSVSENYFVHGFLEYDNAKLNKHFPIKTESLGSLLEGLGKASVPIIIDGERNQVLYVGSHLDPELEDISKSALRKWNRAFGKTKSGPLAQCWLHSVWRRLYTATRTASVADKLDAFGDMPLHIEKCYDAVRGNSTARAYAHARVYVTTKYIVSKKLKNDLKILLSYLRTVDDSSIPRYIVPIEKLLGTEDLPEISVRSVIENYGEIFKVTDPERVILEFEDALSGEGSQPASESFNLPESLFSLFFFLRHALKLLGATQEHLDQEDSLRAEDQEAEKKLETGRAARRILLCFDELFVEKTGSKYIRTNWASEMKTAKDLLKSLSEDQICGRLQRFFEDDWIATHKAYSVKTFAKMINRLADMDGVDDRSEYWELVNKAQNQS